MLRTAQDVIIRSGLKGDPDYEDLSPINDGAGFYVFRRYPTGTTLARVVTNDGRPAVRCYLSLALARPGDGGQVRRVYVRAWLARRWNPANELAWTGDDPYAVRQGDPDAPSAASRVLLAKGRKPIPLYDTDSYVYDEREDIFLRDDGSQVTVAQMLDDLYQKHCRTVRLGFRLRWRLGSLGRKVVYWLVWKGQDGAMWLLLTFYDVEVAEVSGSRRRSPFHEYHLSDFHRATEAGERSHFFGFQSSQKSFFTNLLVVGVLFLVAYWKLPHEGLPRAIYDNTALTTAALVLSFLLADKCGPWVLELTILSLSRLRWATVFLRRKVHV